MKKSNNREEITLLELINLIWRGKFFILLFTLSITIVTILILLNIPPAYETTLAIKIPKITFFVDNQPIKYEISPLEVETFANCNFPNSSALKSYFFS